MSKFWLALCKQPRIQARMSTAYHHETDGQTEQLNGVMEQYLRYYVSYQEEDWADWLPIAEFAANNQVFTAPNATPFFNNYGYHPQLNYEHLTRPTTPQTKDAHKFANRMLDLQQHLRTQLKVAQDKYKNSTNKHRTPAPPTRSATKYFSPQKAYAPPERQGNSTGSA